jgi:hypothetical protein
MEPDRGPPVEGKTAAAVIVVLGENSSCEAWSGRIETEIPRLRIKSSNCPLRTLFAYVHYDPEGQSTLKQAEGRTIDRRQPA